MVAQFYTLNGFLKNINTTINMALWKSPHVCLWKWHPKGCSLGYLWSDRRRQSAMGKLCHQVWKGVAH